MGKKDIVAEAEEEAVEEVPKQKKDKKAKKAAKVEEEAAEEEVPKQKKDKKAKKAAAVEEEAAEEEEEAPKQKKDKKAKQAAAAEEEEAEEVPKQKKDKKAKKAAVAKEEEEDEPPKKKAKTEENTAEDGDDRDALKVFIGGLPFSASEDQIRKDFAECGEITDLHIPKNEEGNPRGFGFITYATQAGVDAALKFDGDDYGGRRLKVNKAGEKGKGKGDKGKGKGKGNDELTVCVRGISWEATEETFRKDFEECGEVERLNLLKNDEGGIRGIAFVSYKTEEGFKKALEFNETEYAGRTIYVSKAGEGGKGKDGKGKDGKGKGKDGKGKGKDGKGKKGKGKVMTEAKAKSSGAMVESTGVKQTFADSDDE